jgi:glycosyltransferase involved in cell wall biosynthesis
MKGLRARPDVTICIPAWQAEPFIDRTLRCARRQTHADVRILVSVDLGEDGTADRCRAHASDDSRIEVFVHAERLGWVQNANFLLDRVSTEFYFLYFHDDVIDESYTERLLEALRRRPDAGSVHCDMGHFGASDSISIGREYLGSSARRLMTFLYAPRKGSPLRSLTRSALLRSGLRLPVEAENGFWANQPFLMKLLAAGPALRLPEVLYWRWDKRPGGLTDGWTRFTLDQIISGYRVSTRLCLVILEGLPATETERELLNFGLYLYMMAQVRQAEASLGVTTRARPEALHSDFAGLRVPEALRQLEPEMEQSARATFARLSEREVEPE